MTHQHHSTQPTGLDTCGANVLCYAARVLGGGVVGAAWDHSEGVLCRKVIGHVQELYALPVEGPQRPNLKTED